MRALRNLFVIIFALTISGCAAGQHSFFKAAPPSENYSVVKVYYGTDRNRTASEKPSECFGCGRGEMSYGLCEVSIPREHRMGKLEAPSVWRLEFREDPEKHIVLLKVTPEDKDKYFSALKERVASSKGSKLFIFIHGYNVTFEDAARRTAQMSYDLGFDGAPVFYSWPSRGTLTGYTIDENNVEWTDAHLRNFIEEVAEKTQAQNIYLIAHSMGTRALTRAFGEAVVEQPGLKNRFREIILAAPDIDTDTFKNYIAPQIIGEGPGVSLYASSKDLALKESKKINGAPRLGDSTGGICIVSGMDSIDATNLDTSLVGHSYYGDRKSILADFYYLINEGQRPDKRFGLEKVSTPSGIYWKFSK